VRSLVFIDCEDFCGTAKKNTYFVKYVTHLDTFQHTGKVSRVGTELEKHRDTTVPMLIYQADV